MDKKIVLAMLVLLFAASAFAQVNNFAPEASIVDEDSSPDTYDWINLRCTDDDWGDGEEDPEEHFCSETLWYYVTDTGECSDQKNDYIYSVVGDRDEEMRVEEGIKTCCSALMSADPQCDVEVGFGENVCLWVEDEDFSHYTISQPILLDCEISDVIMISPTTGDPARRGNTDDVDIVFEVVDEDIVRYQVMISGDALLCSETGAISGSGPYSHNCDWVDAEEGAYNVIVKIRDAAENERILIERDALIIETAESPNCLATANIYMLGTSLGEADVLNLNEICTDPEGGNLTYSIIDASDCLDTGQDLAESVSVEPATGMVSVGAVPAGRNETITDFSDTCTVQYRAVDETALETISTFDITVFQVGEIELKMRYPGIADGGTDADIQEFDFPVVTEPGEEICFDIIIENGLNPSAMTSPLDLAFVLDASGSMTDEIEAARNAINSGIADYVVSQCEAGGLDPLTCFRLGVVVMDGGSIVPGGSLTEWQRDLTNDIDSIKDFVDNVDDYCGIEPWADYIINLIDPAADPVRRFADGDVDIQVMSWGLEAIKLIIVITDATNDGQTVERYSYTEVVDYAFPAGIIVSGIGVAAGANADPAGQYAGSLDELIVVANQTGGTVIAYDNDGDADVTEIQQAIMDLIEITIADDDVLVEGPPIVEWPPNFDGIVTVPRGGSLEIPNVCITIPGVEEEYEFSISDPDDPATEYDEIDIEISFEPVEPVTAVMTLPVDPEEGEIATFGGSLSTSDPADPIVQWAWDFGDLSPVETVAVDTITHTYADNGTYSVTLTVTTQNNNADSQTRDLVVLNKAPSVNIDADKESVLPGVPITFIASIDDVQADLPAESIDWDFEDPPSRSGEEVSHSWGVPGNYIVRVWVTDKDGGVGTDTKLIRVSSAGDILAIEEIVTFEGDEETTMFGPEDTVDIEVTVANIYIDPDWGPMAVKMRWEIRIVDVITNEVLHTEASRGIMVIGPAAEEIIRTSIDLAPLDLEEGNYIIEASVTVKDSSVNEIYLANNHDMRIISVGKPRTVPVPEMPVFLLPLILLAVLILIKRE